MHRSGPSFGLSVRRWANLFQQSPGLTICGCEANDRLQMYNGLFFPSLFKKDSASVKVRRRVLRPVPHGRLKGSQPSVFFSQTIEHEPTIVVCQSIIWFQFGRAAKVLFRLSEFVSDKMDDAPLKANLRRVGMPATGPL